MSELKVYRDPKDGPAYREFYEKSEADKVIARHKYKRCLAMARWCNDRFILDDCLYELGKTRFYERWEKRWLELAEMFK